MGGLGRDREKLFRRSWILSVGVLAYTSISSTSTSDPERWRQTRATSGVTQNIANGRGSSLRHGRIGLACLLSNEGTRPRSVDRNEERERKLRRRERYAESKGARTKELPNCEMINS